MKKILLSLFILFSLSLNAEKVYIVTSVSHCEFPSKTWTKPGILIPFKMTVDLVYGYINLYMEPMQLFTVVSVERGVVKGSLSLIVCKCLGPGNEPCSIMLLMSTTGKNTLWLTVDDFECKMTFEPCDEFYKFK